MSSGRTLQLAAQDGTRLFINDWPVERGNGQSNAQSNAQGNQLGGQQDNKRGILLMHGLGEHCGRYAHVARVFNDCGWSVRAYDHRGHGRSGGPRGDAPDEQTLLGDAKLVFDDFSRQFAAPPLLLGHSMGGLFAARFAVGALSPIGGLILSSPALALPLSRSQKLLLKILSAIAPGLRVPNGLQTRYLSHDPAVEEAYIKDPLVHSRITARLLRAMLAAIDVSHAGAAALSIPTLMVVAGDDRLVDPAGSDAFFARLPPGIGSMHRYPDYYHEIFNEIGAARVFDDVRAWLGTLHR